MEAGRVERTDAAAQLLIPAEFPRHEQRTKKATMNSVKVT